MTELDHFCRAAAGLLVAMARSTHQDAEGEPSKDMQPAVQQAEILQPEPLQPPQEQMPATALYVCIRCLAALSTVAASDAHAFAICPLVTLWSTQSCLEM